MVVIIGEVIALIALIYISSGLVPSFIKKMAPSKALFSCSILLLLQIINIQVVYNFLLLKLLVSNCIISIHYFFSFSNHFIISLDIRSFYNNLIVIRNHTLKTEKFLPKRRFI